MCESRRAYAWKCSGAAPGRRFANQVGRTIASDRSIRGWSWNVAGASHHKVTFGHDGVFGYLAQGFGHEEVVADLLLAGQ